MKEKLARYGRLFSQYLTSGKPNLAYIGGVHGSRNLGDEALRIAAERLFNKCSLLDYPRKRHTARLAKCVLPFRNALLAGGTLINQQEIWYDLVRIYLPRVPNFVVFGTGVANPSFWPDRRNEWAALLEKCSFVGVRGPLSALLLEEAGVKNVEVVGDPALVFATAPLEQASNYTQGLLGINIGWDRVNQYGNESEIVEEARRLAVLARKAGWQIRWFVVCPADLSLVKKIAAESETDADIVVNYDQPEEYVRMAGECSVFIGSRLHAVVLATCAYVPSLMLEYRPKCRDYMYSIGQDESVIRTDAFSAADAWEKLSIMCNRRTECANDLHAQIRQIRETQDNHAVNLESRMLTAYCR